MLLALDIGNTSVSFGVFGSDNEKDKLMFSSKISVQKNRSADEYAALINDILRLHITDFDKNNICNAAISSVVPSVTPAVYGAAEILSSNKPYVIGPGCKTGFKIDINDPACLGADIVSNTAAAFDMLEPPFLIYDAGTANTITVVDRTGTLIGTVIMPGIHISASALHDNAELLETIALSSINTPLIGKNTEESVRSGLIYGNAIMLDGFVRNIREQIVNKDSGDKLGLVATGGFSKTVVRFCRNKFICDDSLTLKGIALLFRKNTSGAN